MKYDGSHSTYQFMTAPGSFSVDDMTSEVPAPGTAPSWISYFAPSGGQGYHHTPACGLTIHYQAFVTDVFTGATATGSDQVLRTPMCMDTGIQGGTSTSVTPAGFLPTVTTTTATPSATTVGTVTLGGNLTGLGVASGTTTVGFTYGGSGVSGGLTSGGSHAVSTSLSPVTTSMNPLTHTGTFSQTITGLNCANSYFYTADATNTTSGTATGNRVSFTVPCTVGTATSSATMTLPITGTPVITASLTAAIQAYFASVFAPHPATPVAAPMKKAN